MYCFEFDSDAYGNTHDGSGFHQFKGDIRINKVVIDHRQSSDAFDSGIHDEVGRILSAAGRGIMNVIIQSLLVPFFRHFQQEILGQIVTDNSWITGSCLLKVMDKL